MVKKLVKDCDLLNNSLVMFRDLFIVIFIGNFYQFVAIFKQLF